RPTLVPMLSGLVAAAVVAAAATAAQLVPVLEFIGQSERAVADGPHDIYPFSLDPARVVEFVWPNVFGTPFHGNQHWLGAVPPKEANVDLWVPTLYLGGLPLVLALGGTRLRSDGQGKPTPWRAWMATIAAVSLIGSL